MTGILLVVALILLTGCGSDEGAGNSGSLNDNLTQDISQETIAQGIEDLPVTVPGEPVTAGEADMFVRAHDGTAGDTVSGHDKVSLSDDALSDFPDIENENTDADMISENAAAEGDTKVLNEEALEENAKTADNDGSDSEGIFTSEEIPDQVFARMSGVSFPADCTISRDDLRYLRLSYNDFNGQVQIGEMVCNKKIADDLIEIFRELYRNGYQIEKMKLIDDYGGDDDLSCADDNTSCFNYRTVAGTTSLSKHAMGVAVDINPFYNPYVTYPDGTERISPPGSEPYADRSADFPHKIGPGDKAYELFMAHGFSWGGNWKSLKDYQHFQKP